MKMTLGDLEEARRDPVAYLLRRRSGEKQFRRYGRAQLLQTVILRYHRYQLTVAAAVQELTRRYHRNFKSAEGLDAVVQAFEEYVDDFPRLGSDPSLYYHRFEVRLPEALANVHRVTGQVPRVDVTDEGGYAAWLFANHTADWRRHLRLPLMQAALATDLAASADEVAVGVYCFEDGRHHRFAFSEEEIASARRELYRLLRELG